MTTDQGGAGGIREPSEANGMMSNGGVEGPKSQIPVPVLCPEGTSVPVLTVHSALWSPQWKHAIEARWTSVELNPVASFYGLKDPMVNENTYSTLRVTCVCLAGNTLRENYMQENNKGNTLLEINNGDHQGSEEECIQSFALRSTGQDNVYMCVLEYMVYEVYNDMGNTK